MKHLFTLILVISMLAACKTKNQVDLVVHNATVYTVDSLFTVAQAFAVDKGKIVAVGTNSEILENYSATETLDLQQRAVYPGFNDAHCHFYGYGLSLQNANLGGAKSWEEVVTILVEHYKKYGGAWVLGRGWDQNLWETKEYPTNELLNKNFPDVPVLITRIDGHAAIVNDAALKLAGVTLKTKVAGGDFLAKNGKLTGVLIDNAEEFVRRFIPQPTQTDKLNALKNAQQNCFAVGLTSVSDAGLDIEMINLIDSLQKANELHMRIDAWLTNEEPTLAHFLPGGIYKTDYLRVGTIKLYSDGALGSRGALLIEPYTDDLHNHGLQVTSDSVLRDVCQRAYNAGYQVATHAIGDAGNRLVLKLYAEILKGANDKRWRIEHAQVVHPQDFELFAKYSIVPSVQTTHATSDMDWADERLGAERIKAAYAYKSLLNQLQWMPNGSDFPIEDINPLYGFYSGVVRKHQNGLPAEGFQTENALTRQEALRAMTIWAAKASFLENEKGSIEPGKYADFVVLDKDIMLAPENELFTVKVLETRIAGKQTYKLK